MPTRRIVVYTFALLLLGQVTYAQQTPGYVFATYYRCTAGKESRADAIYKGTIAPLLDKQVKEGRITDFGWNRHWMGGAWRRVEYMQGTNLDKMVDARNQYIEAMQSQRAVSDEFDSICNSHDDYIWQVGAQSAATTTPPPASLSQYLRCESNEAEADAIVTEAIAPVLNQHVKDGKIASWSWLQHMAGGQARRVLILRAASPKALLSYWATLDQALEAAQPDRYKRYSTICFDHSDYIWESTPR